MANKTLDKVVNSLRSFFNIGVRKHKGQKSLQPDIKRDKKRTKPLMQQNDIDVSFDRIWKWYILSNYESNETIKDRICRYNDMDYMVLNDGYISMAAELYADEAAQSDVQDQTIGVEAKDNKIVKEIETLLQDWGYDQSNIRNHCYNIPLYGDSFTINSLDYNKGYYDVEHIDVRDIADRIEFKLSEVKKNYYKRNKAYSVIDSEPRLSQLRKILDAPADVAQYYRSFLFGYMIDKDLYLPPWNVTHFRLFTTKPEFYPWGRSLFINSLALFKKLKTSENLMVMARAGKFPKDIFQVKIPDSATATDAWEKTAEAKDEWHNMTQEGRNKEQFSVGSEVWLPDNLLSYDMKENRMNLDDIADIELLRDEMITACRIPKGYLIVDRASFGTSGQSLLQQFKPFGRAVYSVQSAFLRELVQMLRIHFMVTEQFDKENTEFSLSMNFPVTEEATDRLRAKQDTLRLASDVVSNIQSALGTRDGLPPDVIKSIFGTLSFISSEDIEDWINKSAKDTKNLPGGSVYSSSPINFNLSEDSKEKIRNRLSEGITNMAYFEALKKKNIQEGIYNQKHIFNSVTNIRSDDRLIFDYLKHNKEKEIKG